MATEEDVIKCWLTALAQEIEKAEVQVTDFTFGPLARQKKKESDSLVKEIKWPYQSPPKS